MSHCIDRAWERYGLELSQADIDALVTQIQSGRSVVIWKTLGGPGVTIHLVRHRATAMIAVYGPGYDGKNRIRTFLPPNALNGGAFRKQHAVHSSVRRARLQRRREAAY